MAKRLVTLFVFSVFSIFSQAQSFSQEEIVIKGIPTVNILQGGKARVIAEVEGGRGRIGEVELFHRGATEREFKRIAMMPLGRGKYSAVMETNGKGTEYFLVASSEDGSSTTFPGDEPSLNPAVIESPPSAGVEIVPLSPEGNAALYERTPLIAFSFLEDGSSVDVGTVTIELDGMDVTREANVTRFIVTLIPQRQLSFGSHTVSVSGRDTTGVELTECLLAFTITKTPMARRLPSIAGDASIDMKSDGISGPGASVRQEPAQTNILKVRASGSFLFLKYGGNIFVTSDEKKLKQPKHRFLGEFRVPYLKVYLGDVTPTYSELALWGRRVRGSETELRAGPVAIKFVTGETKRKIEGEGALFQPDSLVVTKSGTFKQNLIGLRTSISRGNTTFGTNFVKVKDDPASISFGTGPRENVVLGTDLGISYLQRRLILEGEGAISFITLDTSRGALTKEEADTTFDISLPFDPSKYEKYFVINSSTVPLNPLDLSSLAYGVRFKGNLKRNIFDILYRSVGSAFYSLGTPSLQNDKQGIKVRDQITLGGGILTGGATYERFKDNLSKDKTATKWTNSTSFSFGFAPGRGSLTRNEKGGFPFGPVVRFSKPALLVLEEHLNSFTFSYRIYERENDAPDTLGGVDDVTRTFNYGIDLGASPFGKLTRLSGLYSNSRKTDNISTSSDLEASTFGFTLQTDLLQLLTPKKRSTQGFLSYVTLLEEGFFRTLTLKTGYSLDRQSFPNQDSLSVDFVSFLVGATKKAFHEKAEVYILFRAVNTEGNENLYHSSRTFIEGGGSYRFPRGLLFALELGTVEFDDRANSSNDYREKIFRVRLTQSF